MTRRRTQTPRRLAPRKLWIYLHSELSTRLDQGVDIVYVIWICKCAKMYHKPQSTMNPKQWSVCLCFIRSCRSRPVHTTPTPRCVHRPGAFSAFSALLLILNLFPSPVLQLCSGNYGTNILLSFELNYTVHYSVACYNQKQSVHFFLLHSRYQPLKVGQERCLIFQRNEHYKGFVMSNKRCHYPTSGCGSLHHNVLC